MAGEYDDSSPQNRDPLNGPQNQNGDYLENGSYDCELISVIRWHCLLAAYVMFSGKWLYVHKRRKYETSTLRKPTPLHFTVQYSAPNNNRLRFQCNRVKDNGIWENTRNASIPILFIMNITISTYLLRPFYSQYYGPGQCLLILNFTQHTFICIPLKLQIY
jgi:hypothetical protein